METHEPSQLGLPIPFPWSRNSIPFSYSIGLTAYLLSYSPLAGRYLLMNLSNSDSLTSFTYQLLSTEGGLAGSFSSSFLSGGQAIWGTFTVEEMNSV